MNKNLLRVSKVKPDELPVVKSTLYKWRHINRFPGLFVKLGAALFADLEAIKILDSQLLDVLIYLLNLNAWRWIMPLANDSIWLKRAIFSLLEFFLPRLCLFCGGVVAQEAQVAVCPECEASIYWVQSPLCPCCGVVFESRQGPDHLCGECQSDPPPFRRARAAVLYEGPPATAIKRFKFGRQLAYLPVLQSWLSQPWCLELLQEANILAPVPLHPRRLKARGFNQALLLAQGFPELPLGREVIVRMRHTVPQIGLNPKQRRENVQGAFAVPHPEQVKGKKILLLDDLYTTGATAKECARVLRKAGARQIEVLTVARVRYE